MIWLTVYLLGVGGWMFDSVEVDTSNVETNQKMLPAADGRLGALKEFHLQQFQNLCECKFIYLHMYTYMCVESSRFSISCCRLLQNQILGEDSHNKGFPSWCFQPI